MQSWKRICKTHLHHFLLPYIDSELYAAGGEMQGQLQEKIAYIAKELQDLANLVLAGTCRTYIGLIWI